MMEAFIQALPKCEVHVHIEGCMPPKMVLEMGIRNGLEDKLPFRSEEEAAAAFNYQDLQEFLDLRDATLQVLVTEQDFYEVTVSYLTAVAVQNVSHSEIFFDPQVHTRRGIGLPVFMAGFLKGMQECKARLGISSSLLMCFMTELGPQDAENTLKQAMPYIDHIAGVGIARGIPNWRGTRSSHSSFAAIFAKCAAMGLKLTAHAGEEGPADELWECINTLKVDRIDHGVSCLRDKQLLQHLKATRLPITVCPLSNFKLQVYKGEYFERMRELIAWDLCTTVNSDDPPFFGTKGGYVNENFEFWAEKLGLTARQIYQLCRNSVEASFLDQASKGALYARLEGVFAEQEPPC